MSDPGTPEHLGDNPYSGYPYGAPALRSLSPSSIAINTPTPVTVTGEDLMDSVILVDGVDQPTTRVTDSSLRYIAQAAATGHQDVAVRSSFGYSNPLQLTVT